MEKEMGGAQQLSEIYKNTIFLEIYRLQDVTSDTKKKNDDTLLHNDLFSKKWKSALLDNDFAISKNQDSDSNW